MTLPKCCVCLETLDETSKMLPCEHTYHQKCLESLYESKKKLICCLCRKEMQILENNATQTIEALPSGVILLEEALRQQRDEIKQRFQKNTLYAQMKRQINDKNLLLEKKDEVIDKYKTVIGVGGIVGGVAALTGLGLYLFGSRNQNNSDEDDED